MITLEEWKEKVKGSHLEFHYWFAPKEDCDCSMLAEYDDDRYKVGQVYEGYSKNGGYVLSAYDEWQLYDFYENAFFPAEDCYWDKAEAEKKAEENLNHHKKQQAEAMKLLTGFLEEVYDDLWEEEE